MKRLVFTVTNDLNFDQRMIRICTSLSRAGYEVWLIGRSTKTSAVLEKKSFNQKRLRCFFHKGKLFYIEYNLRLFFFLLVKKFHLICAIDLDTILPCLLVSKIKRVPKVYDAHELFCEMKEVVSRKAVYRIWKFIERKTVPRFQYGYTVNTPIQQILKNEYGVDYLVIRNIPVLLPEVQTAVPENFIMYQGAVNQGRSFETLIPAFQWIDMPLHIYGDGNFLEAAKELAAMYGLQQKVLFKGKAQPEVLRKITPRAVMGITIFENKGLSNYYSLANRFFDYIHAGIPQICVDYPAYREINEVYHVALLINDLSPEALAQKVNELIRNEGLQKELRTNCVKAREALNWQGEEQKLTDFYAKILKH